MSLNNGDIIDGKYRIVRLIGEGGMGSVFEGENIRIHRQVAIKVLHSSVAESVDAVQRFEREAQAAGRIGSEHIVEVLDLGELPGGDRYMVMEYLDGEALNDRIRNRGRLAPREAAAIVVQLLEGLCAAHDAGIVHRDLKPENVFLLKNKGGRKDFVKIVDFGISKFSSLGGEFSMTRTGAVMGTPYYLSPEQAKGDRSLDHRADLYAVGVILYEAVAGAVPFDGETFNELLFKIVLEPVKPLSTVALDIDAAFSSIVNKAMARDPEARYQSARELQEALSAWLNGEAGKTLSAGVGQGSVSSMDAADGTGRTVLGVGPGAHGTTAIGPQGLTESQGLSGPQGLTESQGGIDRGTLDRPINKTHGAWANTNPDGRPTQSAKRKTLLAAAVVLIAGGGAFAFRSQSIAEEKAALARAELKQQEEEERERIRLEKVAQLEAEKAKAEAEKLAAERARLLAEKRTVEARLTAVEQARQKEQERAAETSRSSNVGVTPKPTTRPASAPEPAPKPAGRKFRTDI